MTGAREDTVLDEHTGLRFRNGDAAAEDADDPDRGRATEPAAPAEKDPEGGSGAGNAQEGAEETQNATRSSADNKARDNHGQLVQAAVLYGGVHNHYSLPDDFFSYGPETARAVRATRRVDPRRVHVVCETLVQPAGYSAFSAELRESGVGIIVGRAHTGRGVTAIRALESTGLEIQEVTPEPHERHWSPERLPAEAGHAYLMDISPLGGVEDEYHMRIREYAARVRSKGACLVVVAKAGQWGEDPTDAFAFLALQAPAAEHVFSRHLAYLTNGAEAQRWLEDPKVGRLLGGMSPAYATRVAAEAARNRPPGSELSETQFSGWVASVMKVFKGWATEIEEWFAAWEREYAKAERNRYRSTADSDDEGQDARHNDYYKALIEAVAVLEGCPSDALMLKVDELAQEWGIPLPFRSPISGTGLRAVLANISAHVADGDRIEFVHPGFGDAVLDHLWCEHPRARHSLLAWSHRAAEAIPWQQRSRVARRWYALAERQSNERPVLGLFAAWGGDPRLRPAVVPVMAEAAVHADLGPKVREYLYDLAFNRGRPGMDIAVTQVCGQYGRAEPRTALTRLSWIADRAVGRTTEVVMGALRSIARESECRPFLVQAMADWVEDGKDRGRAAIAGLFLCELIAEQADGVPALIADVVSPSSEMSTTVVGVAVAAAVAGTTAEYGTALDVWLSALGTDRPAEVSAAIGRVLVYAGSLSTPVNVGLVERIEKRRGPGVDDPVAALAPRVLAADPLLGPVPAADAGSEMP